MSGQPDTAVDRSLIAGLTVPATPAPAPMSLPTPTTGGGLDVNARVKVGDKEMTVAELIAAQAGRGREDSETAAEKEYNKWARIALKGEASREDQIKAHRFLMSKDGYSPEQIEAHIANAFPDAPAHPQQTGGGEDEQTELERLRAEVSRDRTERIAEQFNNEVERQLDSHEGLKLLFKTAETLGQDPKKAKDIAVQKVFAQTKEILRRLTAQTGQRITSQMLKAAVKEAADEHVQTLRSYIGDPGRLGRSSETVADSFTDAEAEADRQVKQPTYKPSEGRSKFDSDLTAWLQAGIRNDAREIARAGSGSLA